MFGRTMRPFGLDGEAFLDDVLPPGHVVVDRFADDVARLREAELQRRGRADRALRIVRRERDAMRLGQGGDAPRFGEAAAVRDVELADFARARVSNRSRNAARFVTRSPVAMGVVTAALIVARPSTHSGQHGSSKK